MMEQAHTLQCYTHLSTSFILSNPSCNHSPSITSTYLSDTALIQCFSTFLNTSTHSHPFWHYLLSFNHGRKLSFTCSWKISTFDRLSHAHYFFIFLEYAWFFSYAHLPTYLFSTFLRSITYFVFTDFTAIFKIMSMQLLISAWMD